MVRNILGILAGMIVGMAVNMGILSISWMVYPLPEGMDMSDMEAFAAYIEGLPSLAFAFVITAHLGQAFVGGWVAARIGKANPYVLAMIIAVLTLMGGVYNLISLPGPVWLWIEVPLYLVVGWAAGMIEAKRRAAA